MYIWKWDLDNKGLKEVSIDMYSDEYLEKHLYVKCYLSPSIHHSHCGWHHCKYYVFDSKYGQQEYVALYPEEQDKNGRFYFVTGESLGSISETIWNGVYR